MIASKVVGIVLAGVLGASTSAAVLFAGSGRRDAVSYDQGKQLFLSRCSTCHAREANAQTSLGPSMFGLFERAGSRVGGLDAAEYVVQSLFEPTAFVVPGFPAVMPGQLLTDATDEEVRSLVGYVLNLGGETDAALIQKVKLPSRAKASAASFDRTEIERGARVFWQEGQCGSCHAAHADEHDGNVAPRIFHVGLTEARLRATLHVRPVVVAEAPAPGTPPAPPSSAPEGALLKAGPHTIQLVSPPSSAERAPSSGDATTAPSDPAQSSDHAVPAPLTLTEADFNALVKVVLLMN